MTQKINVTNGAVEYTYPLTITEKTGKDISAVSISLSLGTLQAPGTWLSPASDPSQTIKSQRVVQLLVSSDTVIPGEYYLWSKVEDNPEILPRRHSKIVVE